MKKKKIFIIVLSIILAILVIVAVFLTVKAFKLKNIIEKAKTYENVNNYYVKTERKFSDGNVEVQEIFFLNGKLKWILNNSNAEVHIDYNSNTGYTVDNTTEKVTIMDSSNFSEVTTNENTVSLLGPAISAESFWDYCDLAIRTKIESNDDSYILTVDKDSKFTVDKDTGICNLEEHYDGDTVTSYIKNEVSFDTVTEEDVQMLNSDEIKNAVS